MGIQGSTQEQPQGCWLYEAFICWEMPAVDCEARAGTVLAKTEFGLQQAFRDIARCLSVLF